jgi:hypothetical protein
VDRHKATPFDPSRDKDRRLATRLRSMLNDVLWKMVSDDDEETKLVSKLMTTRCPKVNVSQS